MCGPLDRMTMTTEATVDKGHRVGMATDLADLTMTAVTIAGGTEATELGAVACNG